MKNPRNVDFCGTEITFRTFKLLKALGVGSWEELSGLTIGEVIRHNGCGAKTLRHLRELLASQNLAFRSPGS